MTKKQKVKINNIIGLINEESSFDGEKVINLIDDFGFLDCLFQSTKLMVEEGNKTLFIRADLVYLIILNEDNNYKLTIE